MLELTIEEATTFFWYNSDSQSLVKWTFLLGDPGCGKKGLVGFPKTTFRKALKIKGLRTRVAKGMNLRNLSSFRKSQKFPS